MLKIGEFSKLSRVSIRMLRHYDELGLLRPIRIDPDTGYRYYRESQLPTASRIAALRDMGFGLSAIGELLACDDPALLERHLLERRAELAQLQSQTARRLRLLGTALQRLRKDGITMKLPVTIKTFPARYAATLRMTIPSYDQEGLLWSELVRRTAPLHLVPDDPCLCAVVFHDREFREADVDVEAQKTVRGAYPDTDGVHFCTLPPVTAATAVCHGSYAQLNDVMAAVAAWVLDNGYTLSGPAFNLYHVSPHETSNPDEFVTEVCYPSHPQPPFLPQVDTPQKPAYNQTQTCEPFIGKRGTAYGSHPDAQPRRQGRDRHDHQLVQKDRRLGRAGRRIVLL